MFFVKNELNAKNEFVFDLYDLDRVRRREFNQSQGRSGSSRTAVSLLGFTTALNRKMKFYCEKFEENQRDD